MSVCLVGCTRALQGQWIGGGNGDGAGRYVQVDGHVSGAGVRGHCKDSGTRARLALGIARRLGLGQRRHEHVTGAAEASGLPQGRSAVEAGLRPGQACPVVTSFSARQ